MDYFQGVVTEFLRADRAVFVNTEFLIQLEPGNMPPRGRSWFCDVLAVNLQAQTGYLCEVTYATSLSLLMKRLQAWSDHWPLLRAALARDASIPQTWLVQPWVFIPGSLLASFRQKAQSIGVGRDSKSKMPRPRITLLENVAPWRYRSWARTDDSVEPFA